MPELGMTIRLAGELGEIKPKVVEALKAQGFGILTEIDVQKTLKDKLNVEFKPYQILGACNPSLSHRALSADESIGLLLPCNVVIKQEPGEVEVSILDPEIMFSLADPSIKETLSDLPFEAKSKLKAALDALKSSTS